MRALRVSQLALGARSVRVAPSASEATSAVAGLPGPAAISVDLRLPTCIHALACPWLPRVVRGPSTWSAGPRGRSNLNRIKYGGDRVIHLLGWLSSCRLRRPRQGRAYVRTCPASCHGHAAGRAGLPPTARHRWPCSAANFAAIALPRGTPTSRWRVARPVGVRLAGARRRQQRSGSKIRDLRSWADQPCCPNAQGGVGARGARERGKGEAGGESGGGWGGERKGGRALQVQGGGELPNPRATMCKPLHMIRRRTTGLPSRPRQIVLYRPGAATAAGRPRRHRWWRR